MITGSNESTLCRKIQSVFFLSIHIRNYNKFYILLYLSSYYAILQGRCKGEQRTTTTPERRTTTTPSVYSKTPTSSSQIHGFLLGFHIPDFSLDYQKNIKYNSNKKAVSSLTPPLYGPHRNSFSPKYFISTGILRTSP